MAHVNRTLPATHGINDAVARFGAVLRRAYARMIDARQRQANAFVRAELRRLGLDRVTPARTGADARRG